MVFGLFRKQPLLEDEAIEWLFQAFAWSIGNFGAVPEGRVLVTPSNRHFPGREESPEGMATLILERVKGYAGVSHWPTRAVDQRGYQNDPRAEPGIAEVLASEGELTLTLFYEPQQLANPQAMIANYAHAIAHHMGTQAAEPPFCEADQWLHLMEAVAVYLGFGLIMANTAHPYRGGGCGSCRSPAMDRSGFLAETEVTYALAIFCVLKAIPAAEVTPHLKGALRPFFKKALKDVAGREDDLALLRRVEAGLPATATSGP